MKRIKVLTDWSGPEIRMVNDVVAHRHGRIKFEELAFATGLLEGDEILSAVRDGVEGVALSVQPNRWSIKARSA
ncbi:hypothetical protein TSA1_15855 [Bradyrhizobium nitroreducens]|uniref:Uncharacterized protein n=1 Tax=Bradyrhizobium nitroreducens TaxID=709803 RepID=A0A2M6UBX5_9BRAD|nr:hypothetical protein TSA1_15855 [Bradyrhizobium nitroreducens]